MVKQSRTVLLALGVAVIFLVGSYGITSTQNEPDQQYMTEEEINELVSSRMAGLAFSLPSDLDLNSVDALTYSLNDVDKTAFLNQDRFVGATAYVGFDDSLSFMENYFLCDGVDDEIEIQTAINYVNAIGGGTVLLDVKGTLNHGPLDLFSGITLKGRGMGVTILKLKAGSEHIANIYFEYKENITIEDLSIDGNSANQASQPGEGTRGIDYYNSKHIMIRRVEVYDTGGVGIYNGGGSVDIVNDACHVHDCSASWDYCGGIHVGTTNMHVDSWTIRNCYIHDNHNGNGIAVYTNPAGTGTIRNGKIHDNILMPSRFSTNVAKEIKVEGDVKNLKIENNIIKAAYSGSNGIWAIRLDTVHGEVEIIDNTLLCDKKFQGKSAIFINDLSNNHTLIQGNTIKGFLTGIEVYQDIPNVIIKNNNIIEYGAIGINTDGVYTVMKDNYIYTSSAVSSGICVKGNAIDAIIEDNDIHCNAPWGIEILAGALNTEILENNFKNNTPLTDGGTGTIYHDKLNKQVFIVTSGDTNVSSGGDIYLPLTGMGTSGLWSTVDQIIPLSGTLKNVHVLLGGTPGEGETVTITLGKGGSETSITCIISDTDITGEDNSHEELVTSYTEQWYYVVSASSGCSSFNIRIGIEFYPSP